MLDLSFSCLTTKVFSLVNFFNIAYVCDRLGIVTREGFLLVLEKLPKKIVLKISVHGVDKIQKNFKDERDDAASNPDWPPGSLSHWAVLCMQHTWEQCTAQHRSFELAGS